MFVDLLKKKRQREKKYKKFRDIYPPKENESRGCPQPMLTNTETICLKCPFNLYSGACPVNTKNQLMASQGEERVLAHR